MACSRENFTFTFMSILGTFLIAPSECPQHEAGRDYWSLSTFPNTHFLILGFRREWNEFFRLLGYYTA
jgi:hypothetical protein